MVFCLCPVEDALSSDVFYYSWKESLLKYFDSYSVFSKDSKQFFGNCCRVANTLFCSEKFNNVSFYEVMRFIEDYMFRYNK